MKGRDLIDAMNRMASAYGVLAKKLREGETIREAYKAGRITEEDLREWREAYAVIKQAGLRDPIVEGFESDHRN